MNNGVGYHQTPSGLMYWDGQRWLLPPQPIGIVPKQTNHALHLLLTILTFWMCGGWLWVWIFVAAANSGEYRKIYR